MWEIFPFGDTLAKQGPVGVALAVVVVMGFLFYKVRISEKDQQIEEYKIDKDQSRVLIQNVSDSNSKVAEALHFMRNAFDVNTQATKQTNHLIEALLNQKEVH